MDHIMHEEKKEEGTFLASGGAGAITVIWFIICATAITLLLSLG